MCLTVWSRCAWRHQRTDESGNSTA